MLTTPLSTTLVTTVGLIAIHSLIAANAVQAAQDLVGDDSRDTSVGPVSSVATRTHLTPVNPPSNSSLTGVAVPASYHSFEFEPAKQAVKPQASLLPELPWSANTAARKSSASLEVSQEDMSNLPSEGASLLSTMPQPSRTTLNQSTAVPPVRQPQSRGLAKSRSLQSTQTKKKVAAKVAATVRLTSGHTAQLWARPLPAIIDTPLAAVATEHPQQYLIQRGDNLYRIAQKLETTIEALIAVNDLEDPDKIYIGAILQIPATELDSAINETTPPQVSSNRTAFSSSSRPSPRTSTVGPQRDAVEQPHLATQHVPAVNEVSMSSGVAPVPFPVSEPAFWRNQHIDVESPLSPNAHEPLPLTSDDLLQYVWPTQGTLTSGYGWRWGRMHRGVDIAAPTGTPIIAAAAGVVEFAGWNSGGYGNLVQIRHSDGSLTRYAHNHRLLVNTGDPVNQGQLIAEVGSTGRSTGPHLHFEIHQPDGRAVNPLEYLVVAKR